MTHHHVGHHHLDGAAFRAAELAARSAAEHASQRACDIARKPVYDRAYTEALEIALAAVLHLRKIETQQV
jgi:hypothetical protein